MKLSYKALVATTAAATIIGVASVGVTRPNRTTAAPSSKSTTSATMAAARPGRPSPPAPAPTPMPTLMASPAQLLMTANTGIQSAHALSVTYSGSGGFLHVMQDSTALAPNPTVTPLGNGQFTVTVRTSDALPEGSYRGRVRLLVCAQTPCATVLATATVPYQMTINWVNVGEWETFQRDAGHTGYVPIAVNPARIALRWEWVRCCVVPTPGINAVATEAGKVYVSEQVPAWSFYALGEANYGEIWSWGVSGGVTDIMSPPAAANGRVYITTVNQQQTALWSLSSASSSLVWKSPFPAQEGEMLAPTIKNDRVHISSDGGIHTYRADDGALLWSRGSDDDHMTTPAVDDSYVYFHDGTGLQVYDVTNGNTIASIADPPLPGQGTSYHGAPMLGTSDNIIAFSGAGAGPRALVNFSLANNLTRWRTAKTYATHPAVANGVIYAASNDSMSLDAISEATGQVLWSWVPGVPDTTFRNNVIVTKNLVFVSANHGLYAVDLATHQAVWSWWPGDLAISGSGALYVVQDTADGAGSSGKLQTFRMR